MADYEDVAANYDTRIGGNVFAGAFELDKLDLIVNQGGNPVTISLVNIFVELNIFEDLYSNVIKGGIILRDSYSYLETMPIIGEEILEVRLKTKGAIGGARSQGQDRKPEAIDNKFRIVSIGNIVDETERVKVYTLNFVSEEYIKNLHQNVQRAYTGTIDDMISDIYMNYLNPGDADVGSVSNPGRVLKLNPDNIEKTKSRHKFTIANMTPFKAINFLASRAISANAGIQPPPPPPSARFTNPSTGSLFFFYEILTDGFRLDSVETLFNKKSKALYSFRPENVQGGGGREHGSHRYYNVKAPIHISAFDVLSNMDAGMYSSRLIAHDIVRMKYHMMDFQYVPQKATISRLSVDASGRSEPVWIEEENPSGKSSPNWPEHQSRRIINDNFNHLEEQYRKGNRLNTDDLDAATITFSPKNNPTVTNLFPTNFQHDVLFNGTRPDDFIRDRDLDFNPASAGAITSPNSFNDLGVLPNNVEDWLLQRETQLKQLSNIRIGFRVPGDSSKHVGDVVEFDYPSHLKIDNVYSGQAHQFYGGKYLITSVRHKLTQTNFETEFELAKDSFKTRLEGQYPGHGTWEGKDTDEALRESGRMKGQSGR